MKKRTIDTQIISGPLSFDGQLRFIKCTLIKGTLECGTVLSNWSLRINGDLYVSEYVDIGTNLEVDGSIYIGKSLFVGRDLRVEDYLSVEGDLEVKGNLYTGHGLDPERDIYVGGKYRVHGNKVSQF